MGVNLNFVEVFTGNPITPLPLNGKKYDKKEKDEQFHPNHPHNLYTSTDKSKCSEYCHILLLGPNSALTRL